MKKLLFIIAILLPASLFAQEGVTFGGGVWNFSLGAGFPNTTHTVINASSSLLQTDGDNNGKSTPFYLASASYGIIPELEIGVFGGFFQSESEIVSAANLLSSILGSSQSYGSAKYSVFTMGGKLVAHQQLFPDIPKLDLYASTYFGWNFVKDDTKIDLGENKTTTVAGVEVDLEEAATILVRNINYPEITYEVNVGGKYAITPNFNIYAEAGYGRFLVNMGLTYSIAPKAKAEK